MLLLVVLAGLGDRVDLPEAVDAQADVLQHGRVVPRDQLGSDDAGVRSVELLHEEAHGIGIEGHVVVAEAEEAALSLHQPEHLVGRHTEAGVGAEIPDERLRQPLDDAPMDIVAGTIGRCARQEEQGVEVGVVLVSERVEGLVEPGPGEWTTTTATTGGAIGASVSTALRGYRPGQKRHRHRVVTFAPRGDGEELLAIVSRLRYID